MTKKPMKKSHFKKFIKSVKQVKKIHRESCKHDNMTIEPIVVGSMCGWKMQDCVDCKRRIGKWKIPISEYDRLLTEVQPKRKR